MAFLSTIGDLLDGSGWTSILAEAGVTTPGKADALLKSSPVKRARYAHTVTCSTLWTLLHQALHFELHWLPVRERIRFKTAVLVFQVPSWTGSRISV